MPLFLSMYNSETRAANVALGLKRIYEGSEGQLTHSSRCWRIITVVRSLIWVQDNRYSLTGAVERGGGVEEFHACRMSPSNVAQKAPESSQSLSTTNELTLRCIHITYNSENFTTFMHWCVASDIYATFLRNKISKTLVPWTIGFTNLMAS